MHSSRRMTTFSSPSCEDLGLPRDAVEYESHDDDSDGPYGQGGYLLPHGEPPHEPIAINGLKYEPENPNNPFSPYCRIPLPNPYGCYEYGMEPAFIRKRNERERERVRCVNDGYARLREHLPVDLKPEKRISKVETLRGAIRYIRQLQGLLDQVDEAGGDKKPGKPVDMKKRKLDARDGAENKDNKEKTDCKRKRLNSLVEDHSAKSRRS